MEIIELRRTIYGRYRMLTRSGPIIQKIGREPVLLGVICMSDS